MTLNREEKHNKGNGRKKRKTAVYILLPFFALAAGLILLFVQTRKPSTIALMETYSYIHQETGDGLLIFNEYAPDFLKNSNLDQTGLQEGRRIRVDDYISSLDETAADRVREEIKVLQNKLTNPENENISREEVSFKIDYLSKVLERGQVIAPKSSMIKLSLDGYEELYSPATITDLQPGDIQVNEQRTTLTTGIKFIDNRIFYVAVDMTQGIEPRDWSIGSEYELIFDGETTIQGILDQIKTDDLNRQLLIFSARNDISSVLDMRFGKVSVASDPLVSYLLPTSAVYEEDGKYYCHRINEQNIIDKVELVLVDSFIDSEEFVVQPTLNEYDQESIKLYDRIILDPSPSQIGEIY